MSSLRDQIAEAIYNGRASGPPDAWETIRASSRLAGYRADAYQRADEVLTKVILPFIENLPAVNLTAPCVECGEPFESEDRVSWRLRYTPEGLIHEECR